MARGKKLKVNDRRLSPKESMPERVQSAVKRAVSNNSTTVAVPSTIQSADDRRNFRIELNKYTIMNRSIPQHAQFRWVDDEIGVGVFSIALIESGTIILNMWGAPGRRTNPTDAVNHRSTIMDDSKNPPEYRLLNGPISFINHACLDHANCVTNFAEEDQVHDFKVLQAVKKIDIDTELTICYSEASHLLCRFCK